MNTHQAELEAIQQAIAIDENHLKAVYEANKDHISFEDYYDIPYLVEKINSSDINKIVLQFTNEILVDSVKVKDLLEAKTGKKIFILSDSAKTGCCVDMVGARHINPDFVVHFGDACLSDRTIHNIQVDYVFPKLKVDLEELKAQIGAIKAEGKITKDLIVIVDVMYNYKNEEIYKTIAQELEGVNVVQTVIPRDSSRLAAEYEHVTFGRYIKKEQASFLGQKKDLLIVGPAESKIIDNLRLSKDIFNIDKVFVCDPYSSCEISEFNDSSKILMKRYFMIEKAKAVDIFGILINKANLDKYKDILERTKTILKQHNKKFYFFIINKLTEPKLGNFPEIGAYINIACPYSTFYDIKDFYKIMINPFELEYAVAGSAWKNYILNDVNNIISQEIPKGAEPVQKEEEERKQEVDSNKDQQLSKVEGQGQLIKLDFLKSLDFHKDRTYKGLDLGVEREVQLAIKGKSGLAREYDDEPHV